MILKIKNFIQILVITASFVVTPTALAYTDNPPVITGPGLPNGGVMILPNGEVYEVPKISSPGVTASTRPFKVEVIPSPVIVQNQTSTVVPRPQTAYAMTIRPTPLLSSNAMLSIVNRFENICPKDVVDFTISYKNLSGGTLTNVILVITIPEQINFDRASSGIYNQGDHTLVVPIGILTPNQEGVVYVSGIARDNAVNYDLIVTKAELVFTTPKGTQDDVTAYAFNNGATCPNKNLAALAFLSGDFFPHSFLGWILLTLIILAIIYVTRKLYKHNREEQHEHGVVHAHA